LFLFAALAAIFAATTYEARERPAETATLEKIARKNDDAAMRAAAAMEARSEAQANAVEKLGGS
jgi:hypothetical protein